MPSASFPLFFLCLLFPFSSSSSPPPVPSCKDFNPNPTHPYNTCIDLPVLGASLYWTYDPTSGTARTAFRVTGVTSYNWVSWGLNPTGSGMVGAQALVAYQTSEGLMRAYTSSIGAYRTRLPETRVSFPVSEIVAQRRENEMVILATLRLPPNKTSISHVWQVGPMLDDRPLPHATHSDNLKAFGTVDFVSGYKGFLSSGAPALWFKIHICLQVSASTIGIIGIILGIVMGHKPHIAHMIIGIVIGICTSIQVISACLRPHKEHKKRPIWTACHYTLGYGVLGLSAANIFLGLGLLGQAPKWWTNSYMAYLIVFGLVWVLSLLLNMLHTKKATSAPENVNDASAC
ncbi:hypothetical protein Cgig2_021789 [Carnegiea gigantea]|uniref:Cytochrome b561 and DOMON domain-containing protein n=1 Tax=Carnegiea gigantea TaxID=171969 RepID=A0A9Q1KAI8_9CARY|nr:hypothetical protein Cgig2_021789 [Carnegiea gigantea]